jgi:signal transduction histidine kinase
VYEDPEVNLIFEVTGNEEVFLEVRARKHHNSALIGASGTKIIFHLLEAQSAANLKLQEYQATLESKIIERTEGVARINDELQKKIFEYQQLNWKLSQINEEKTRYLIHATHQLKAPFAAIQSYADIIIEGFAGRVSKQVLEIMTKIRKRCGMLTAAIQDMLELANIKTVVKEQLKIEPILVNQVISETVHQFKDVAQKRRITIKYDVPKEHFWSRGDRDQVDALFNNLLDNAINYSPDNTQIEVLFDRRSANWISVAVRDQGIGIPEEKVGKIFNEYFRSNNAVAQHESGSGLGLSIVKEIAQLHNFNITVESKLGAGSTFTVTMPSIEFEEQ